MDLAPLYLIALFLIVGLLWDRRAEPDPEGWDHPRWMWAAVATVLLGTAVAYVVTIFRRFKW